MPLHAEQEPVGQVLALNRLNDAIAVMRADTQSIAQTVDGLPVQRVGPETCLAHDLVQRGSILHADLLGRQRRPHARHVFVSSVNILMQ
jgi:hypothetical protein